MLKKIGTSKKSSAQTRPRDFFKIKIGKTSLRLEQTEGQRKIEFYDSFKTAKNQLLKTAYCGGFKFYKYRTIVRKIN